MTQNPSQGPLILKLRDALATIINPKSGKNIVAEGRISGLAVDPEGKARFTLDIGDNNQGEATSLLSVAKTAAQGIEGINSVQAIATAHNPARAKPSPKGAPDAASNKQQGRGRVMGGHDNPLAIPAQSNPQNNNAPKSLKDFARTGGPTKQDRIDESQKALSGVKNVIAVASGKGGVGKSTITVNLAIALAKQGLQVGILDADIYGPSLPLMLGLKGKPEIIDGKIQPFNAFGLKAISIGMLVSEEKALAWRGPMVMGAIRQLINDVAWGELDILMIDTPPGTGDAHLTLIQSGQLDGVVIVTTPQEMALADVRRGVNLFQQTKIPIIGLIENMSWLALPDGTHQHIFGEGGAACTAANLDIPFLGEMPIEPALNHANDQGRPYLVNEDKSPAAKTLNIIAKKIAANTDHP